MDKKKDSATTQMENVENALTQAESFVLRNQKILTNVVLAVLICAVGIVAIHRYYVVPRRAEAAVQDLNEICGDIVDTVSKLTTRVRISFEPCKGTCFVNGSRERLERLILNVLAYSFQRCGEGDCISLRTELRGSEISLYFRDNGTGAEGASIADLYSALERDPLHGASLGGAGLGLLVAEEIAGLYGGSLLLSAAGETGMEAILNLPRARSSVFRVPAEEYGSRLRGILTILADELERDKYMAPYL